MKENCLKTFLVTINVIVMFIGVILLIGGCLLEFLPQITNILSSLVIELTSGQIGAIALTLIVVGAFIFLVAFFGCCGATNESPGLLLLYFIFLLILFLAQIGIVVAAFVFREGEIFSEIDNQLRIYVEDYYINQRYETRMDLVQDFFDCCGYDGPNDYQNQSQVLDVVNSTQFYTTTYIETNISANFFLNGFWPASCCKSGADVNNCRNFTLPKRKLEEYLNFEGCTTKIEEWLKSYFVIIGAVILGCLIIELIGMIVACTLRNKLD